MVTPDDMRHDRLTYKHQDKYELIGYRK